VFSWFLDLYFGNCYWAFLRSLSRDDDEEADEELTSDLETEIDTEVEGRDFDLKIDFGLFMTDLPRSGPGWSSISSLMMTLIVCL
jgi:hypothetical protein